jgi:hypothetical protein
MVDVGGGAENVRDPRLPRLKPPPMRAWALADSRENPTNFAEHQLLLPAAATAARCSNEHCEKHIGT